MKKYKFPQFQLEITDPNVSIDMDTIQDKAVSKLLSVSIILDTDKASFGVIAKDMPYVDMWEDSDIENMVQNWLQNFKI